MFIWIAKKNSKFHAKRLNWSENMLKSFRRGATVLGGGEEGGYCFLKHPETYVTRHILLLFLDDH